MTIKQSFGYIFFTVVIILVFGCPSTGFLMAKPKVTMFREAGHPKAPTDQIDVFYTTRPDRRYEEIARIEVGDTDDDWSMKQIMAKAREIGADGIIIIGRVGSYGFGAGTATDTGTFAATSGFGVGEGYGLTAVAIRYK